MKPGIGSLEKKSENEYGVRRLGLTTPSVLVIGSSQRLPQIPNHGASPS